METTILHAAHDRRARLNNPWLSDFLGKDFVIEYQQNGYTQAIWCTISSLDETRRFYGVSPSPHGREGCEGLIICDHVQLALDNAIAEAFKAFVQTLPRIDRILRYGT